MAHCSRQVHHNDCRTIDLEDALPQQHAGEEVEHVQQQQLDAHLRGRQTATLVA